MIVELTEDEQAVARTVGQQAYDAVRARGAGNRLGGRDTTLEEHVRAAAAELAAARRFNRYPTAIMGRGAAADVGTGLQVRSTAHAAGHLIVHPEDPPDHHYCLVVALGGGRFDVSDAIPGPAARLDEYWRIDGYGHGGWWIPQAKLARPAAV